jgi:hypothetical protein
MSALPNAALAEPKPAKAKWKFRFASGLVSEGSGDIPDRIARLIGSLLIFGAASGVEILETDRKLVCVSHPGGGLLSVEWQDASGEVLETVWSCDQPYIDPAATTPGLSDDDMRDLWRRAGGEFHGPHIETGTLEEEKLLPLLRKMLRGEVVVGDPQG